MARPQPRPHRSPLSWLLLPLLLGYGLAPMLPTAPLKLAVAGTLLSGVAFGISGWNGKGWARVWTGAALLAGVLLAGGYLQHVMRPPPGWEGLPSREAVLTVRLERLFNSKVGRVHGLGSIAEAEGHLRDLVGRKIYFSMDPGTVAEGWVRGMKLEAVGLLESLAPDPAGEDAFSDYLAGVGVQFRFRRVALERAVPPIGFSAFCANQHERLERSLRRGSAPDESFVDVYVAMLLGKRGAMTEAQKEAFLRTGTFHLFAISGLHIGILAFALYRLLGLLRIPEKTAALLGLASLFCFVEITGAAPSAFRAFLMVAFFWGARFLGRAPNPGAALVNSAFLVLLLYPHQLAGPGFQLSYSVVLGILFLGVPLSRRLEERWLPFGRLPEGSMNWVQRRVSGFGKEVIGLFAISLAATLISSPLSIHYFELFTPGGVILNLLLIPLASLVLVAGFISVVLGFAGLGILGIVFNHAAWLVLVLMEKIVEAGLSVPMLFWRAKFAYPWQGPVLLLVLMGTLLLCAHRRWKAPFFHFAVPFLVFLVGLQAARLTFLAP